MKFVTPGLKFKGTFSFDKFSATSVTRSKNPYYYNPATARDAEGNIITDVQTTGQEFLGYAKGAEWGDQSIYLEGMFSRPGFSRKRTFHADGCHFTVSIK